MRHQDRHARSRHLAAVGYATVFNYTTQCIEVTSTAPGAQVFGKRLVRSPSSKRGTSSPD